MSCHHQEQNLPHNSVKTIRTVDNKISEKKCYGRKYKILLLQVAQQRGNGRQSTEKRDVRYGDVELKRKVCLGVFVGPGVSLHQGAPRYDGWCHGHWGRGTPHVPSAPSCHPLPSIHYHNIAGHCHSLPTLPTHLGSIHDVMIPEPTWILTEQGQGGRDGSTNRKT